MELPPQSQLQNQEFATLPEKKHSILLSLPFFLYGVILLLLLLTLLGTGTVSYILFIIPLAIIIILVTTFGIIKKQPWAGFLGFILNLLATFAVPVPLIAAFRLFLFDANQSKDVQFLESFFIIVGTLALLITVFTIRPLWKLWHSKTTGTADQTELRNQNIISPIRQLMGANILATIIIINFIVIILTEILAEVISSYRFKPFLYVHSSLVLFAVSTLLFYRFKKSAGDDYEKAILVLQKIRKYLFLSLIIAIPICLLTWLFSGIADYNVFEKNIFFPLMLMVPPYIFLTALITIPILKSLLNRKNDVNSLDQTDPPNQLTVSSDQNSLS